MHFDEDFRASSGKRDNKGIFLRLCGYIMNFWYLFIPAVILTLVANQLALLGPMYSGQAIDLIAAAEGINFDEV